MIREPHEYLSFLMGADAIADDELSRLGVTILEGAGSAFRGLLIPQASVSAYQALVREKITPGYWNEIVGRDEIVFTFKLADGTIRELSLCEATSSEIARLCSAFSKDPIQKTSDIPRYLAGNPFYREAIEAFHSHPSRQRDSPA
jgi:hypothetical protein